MTTRTKAEKNALVDKFFHSFDEHDRVKYQGHVLAHLGDHFYLVETFSWVGGDRYNQLVFSLEEMKSWWFYDTSEEMADMYEHRMSGIHKPQPEDVP